MALENDEHVGLIKSTGGGVLKSSSMASISIATSWSDPSCAGPTGELTGRLARVLVLEVAAGTALEASLGNGMTSCGAGVRISTRFRSDVLMGKSRRLSMSHGLSYESWT